MRVPPVTPHAVAQAVDRTDPELGVEEAEAVARHDERDGAARRDELLEHLEVRAARAVQPDELVDDEIVEAEDELEPDPDDDYR